MKRFRKHSDETLIALYAQGCNEAFDALLMRYDAYIHSYIKYSIQDEDLVEDIFQDTFIKVMTTIKAGRYTEQARFKQWLVRIAHNIIMDCFRRQKTATKLESYNREETISEALHLATDELNSEEQMIQHDSLDELYNKLNLLPEEQKQVVHLRLWEDKSFKEISEATGVSINTALGRMRYALANLRKHFASSAV